MKPVLVALALLLGVTASSKAGDEVAQSVELALPYLEEEGTWWIEKKECASCHHTTFLTWAKDLALEAGLAVEKESLEEQRKWVLEFFFSPIPPDPKYPDKKPDPDVMRGTRNIEGISQFLVSPSAALVSQDERDKLRGMIVSNQADNGDWKPGGQLPKQVRPKEETQWISNQWALRALGSEAKADKQPPAIPEGSHAKTNEWYAMNAFLESSPEAIQRLIDRQNEDGGWSWMDGEPSSPTGTGQALFALGRTGSVKENADLIARAEQYLVSTQSKEGYWKTRSTKDREDFTRVSNFWGTAWAVIGLLEAGKSE